MQRGQRSAPWKATWKGQLRFGLVSFPVEAINVRSKEEGTSTSINSTPPATAGFATTRFAPCTAKLPIARSSRPTSTSPANTSRSSPTNSTPCGPTASGRWRSTTSSSRRPSIRSISTAAPIISFPPVPKQSSPIRCCVGPCEHQDRWGVGQVVMSGRDQLVLVRPQGELLIMAMLVFPAEIRSTDEIELPPLAKVDAAKDETG